jgi:hypothetical protein
LKINNNKNMSSIYKYGYDPVGRIESDGYVFDESGEPIGRVRGGDVYDFAGEYVGKVTSDGNVWDSSGEMVGTVTDDGRILDQHGNEVGEAESPHMQEGGAAFLLLFR